MFLHAPVEGHVGVLQFGALMSKAAIHIHVQAFVRTKVENSLDQYKGA